MNELKIFNNENFGSVRTVTKDDSIYFVAVDVAKILEYTNPNKAIRDHCRWVNESFIETKAGRRKASIIKKSDVLRLISRSTMSKAYEFESWVFDEVLPSVLETGSYSIKQLSQLEILQKSIGVLVEHESKIKAIENNMIALNDKIDNTKLVNSSVTILTGDVRKDINIIIRAYATQENITFKNAYNLFYSKFNYYFDTNIRSYLDYRDKKKNKLEIIIENFDNDTVLQFVKETFMKKGA